MNQVVHILRKDAAQLWRQVTLPASALVLATLLQARDWSFGVPLLFPLSTVVLGLLLLFCMSWIVLIVSLIQAERLVGLNQFWTTRPYRWRKLLAAKLAFLLVFLYLPLLLSQLILLLCSGLPVVEYSCAAAEPRSVHLCHRPSRVLRTAVTRSIQQAAGVLCSFLLGGRAHRFPCLRAPKARAASAFPRGDRALSGRPCSSLIHQYRTRNTLESIRVSVFAPAPSRPARVCISLFRGP